MEIVFANRVQNAGVFNGGKGSCADKCVINCTNTYDEEHKTFGRLEIPTKFQWEDKISFEWYIKVGEQLYNIEANETSNSTYVTILDLYLIHDRDSGLYVKLSGNNSISLKVGSDPEKSETLFNLKWHTQYVHVVLVKNELNLELYVQNNIVFSY